MQSSVHCLLAGLALFGPAAQAAQPAKPSPDRPAAFRVPALWEYSAPLIAPEKRDASPGRAQKDPTVVFHGGRWHVFMTVKLPSKSAIEYCAFEKWEPKRAGSVNLHSRGDRGIAVVSHAGSPTGLPFDPSLVSAAGEVDWTTLASK